MSNITTCKGKIILYGRDEIVTFYEFNLENVDKFAPDMKIENTDSGNEKDEKTRKAKSSDEDSIHCICISSCGRFLAVATDQKQLIVFRDKKQVNKAVLSRKASKMTFTNTDSGFLVVADKNGDVYSLDISKPDSEPKLILGHLSMLLDICLTTDDRFVLTADRDEKIRVSHFPNSYNIETFCLGHIDFVTSISLMDDGLLVSGSGDGTVRVWKYLEGKELKKRYVYKDVDIQCSKEVNVEKQVENMSVDVKRSPVSDTPAVIKIKSFKNTYTFIVQMEELEGCLVYSYNPLNKDIILHQTIKFDTKLLDYSIDADHVLFLTHTKGPESKFCILRYRLKENKLEESGSLPVPADILACTENSLGGDRESLHKRWFDNMKDYLERKQIRLEQSKAKALALKESSELPCKKLKVAAS